MTIELILAQLDRIAADSEYYVDGNEIDLTINDFDGFDEDWGEIFREYDNAEAVEEVLDWLEENADCVHDDYYCQYYFGDIVVEVGYTSFDI